MTYTNGPPTNENPDGSAPDVYEYSIFNYMLLYQLSIIYHLLYLRKISRVRLLIPIRSESNIYNAIQFTAVKIHVITIIIVSLLLKLWS